MYLFHIYSYFCYFTLQITGAVSHNVLCMMHLFLQAPSQGSPPLDQTSVLRRSGCCSRLCISNKFPGDAGASGPRAILCPATVPSSTGSPKACGGSTCLTLLISGKDYDTLSILSCTTGFLFCFFGFAPIGNYFVPPAIILFHSQLKLIQRN